jgi:O-antigen ligase
VSRLVWQAGSGQVADVASNRWVRGAVLAGALLTVDLVIALAIVDPRFQRLVLLGLGVVALALVFRFPAAAVVGVLFLVTSIVQPGEFKAPFGPIEFRLEELVLGALLLVALVRPRRAWWGGVAGAALVAFIAVIALSGVLAMAAERATFSEVFAVARLFAPVLLFFVLVRLFPEPLQMRRILFAAVVLAALAGLVSIFVAAPGSPIGAALNISGDETIRASYSGLGLVNRVRLPGVNLAYGLFWYAVVQAIAAHAGQRVLWLALLAPMAAGLALSFNRNMWVGLAFGLVVIMVMSRNVARRHIVVVLAILAAAGAAFVLSGKSVPTDSPLYPIVERGSTLFQPSQETRDSSIQERVVETRRATAAIRRHPVTGVGPGASFGNTGMAQNAAGAFIRQDARFMHNQYLFLLIIGGPAALLAFLTFLGAPLLAVLRNRWSSDGLVALAVGILLTMISAIVAIVFADPTSAAVLALLGAAIVVLTSRPIAPPA